MCAVAAAIVVVVALAADIFLWNHVDLFVHQFGLNQFSLLCKMAAREKCKNSTSSDKYRLLRKETAEQFLLCTFHCNLHKFHFILLLIILFHAHFGVYILFARECRAVRTTN